jgi:phage FluMu protein Com
MKKERAQNTAAEPIRCECGNLVARLVPGGVEIKCRRCKRQIVIPLPATTAVKNSSSDRKP